MDVPTVPWTWRASAFRSLLIRPFLPSRCSLPEDLGSKLRADKGRSSLSKPFSERPLPPRSERHDARLFEILFKHGRLGTGELGIDDVQGCLIVQPEGSVVEIGRAHGYEQLIDDEDLAVVHRGSVFRDERAQRQQSTPPGPG